MAARAVGGPSGTTDCVLFYENTANMSADIYTKSFKDETAWSHALKLINMFMPGELSSSKLVEWLETRAALANQPPADGQRNSAWSREGQKRQKLADLNRDRRQGKK